MTGVVVCGGSISDYEAVKSYIEKADLIICADCGAVHIKKLNAAPQLLVGDMDSISPGDLESMKSMGVELICLPVEKDVTDTEFAVYTAVEKGCGRIYMLGALGSRIDHSLSNIFLLKKLLEKGVRGIIADGKNEITLIKGHASMDVGFDEHGGAGHVVSLIPLSETAYGITTKGLYYPLKGEDIEMGSSRGVSNEIVGSPAEVSLEGGLLLVIRSKD